MFEIYVILSLLIGLWSASRGFGIYGSFLSGLFISIFLTPVIGVLFVLFKDRKYEV